MTILLRIVFILYTMGVLLVFAKMFKDFNSLPEDAEGKSSLAWGNIFACTWLVHCVWSLVKG